MRSSPPSWWLGLRSAVFMAGLFLSIAVYAVLMLFTLPLSIKQRDRFVNGWVRFTNRWLRVCCGLTYKVDGLERLPKTPAVVLARHSSTWETFTFPIILPLCAWIVKRELLRIPFFGWGLAMMQPIAIDRGRRRSAVEQIARQGAQRLEEGLWVICFPESTRMAPGQTRRFGMGGAVLAARTGAPVVPVAHNAGCYWPRRRFIKYPGTIRVVIGPVIETGGLTPSEINARAKAWIDRQTRQLELGVKS